LHTTSFDQRKYKKLYLYLKERVRKYEDKEFREIIFFIKENNKKLKF